MLRGSALLEKCKPLIGVVHLPPLPGSPGYGRRPYPFPYGKTYTMEDIIEYAVEEARKYESTGFDAVIIENYGDKPYKPIPGPEETAAMSVIARAVRRATSIPIGISMLRNAPHAALIAAHIAGAHLIRANSLCETRVSPEGILAPQARRLAEEAALLGAYQQILRGDIAILADIDVKHSHPLAPQPPEEALLECHTRAGLPIHAYIATGPRTGQPPEQPYLEKLAAQAQKLGTPLLIGSGVDTENIPRLWRTSDGFIVGTAAKLGGRTENMVSIEKAQRIAQIVQRYRKVWPCQQTHRE